MIDHLLRFKDKDEFYDVLRFMLRDGIPIISSDFYIDIIGETTIKEGVYDAGGNVLYDPVFDKRWHVNIRCTELISLTIPDKYKVSPEAPVRGWF